MRWISVRLSSSPYFVVLKPTVNSAMSRARSVRVYRFSAQHGMLASGLPRLGVDWTGEQALVSL